MDPLLITIYLLVMDSELRRAEDTLSQYNMWSTDLAALAMRTNINNLQQVRVLLVTLKRGLSLSHLSLLTHVLLCHPCLSLCGLCSFIFFSVSVFAQCLPALNMLP